MEMANIKLRKIYAIIEENIDVDNKFVMEIFLFNVCWGDFTNLTSVG